MCNEHGVDEDEEDKESEPVHQVPVAGSLSLHCRLSATSWRRCKGNGSLLPTTCWRYMTSLTFGTVTSKKRISRFLHTLL